MQPTPPGWYWDPGNRPGLFRWWDGHEWTPAISARRDAGPPTPPVLPSPGLDGRFTAGGLSFPVLADPWRPCPGYPDIDDVAGQEMVAGKTPRGPYVGVVFIGGLPSRFGDELSTAGKAFADEMLYMYYPHEKPHSGLDPHLEPVLGRPAWTLSVPLDIDDPSLDFLEEDALFVVVETRTGLGVLFASLPRVPGVPSPEQVRADLQLT